MRTRRSAPARTSWSNALSWPSPDLIRGSVAAIHVFGERQRTKDVDPRTKSADDGGEDLKDKHQNPTLPACPRSSRASTSCGAGAAKDGDPRIKSADDGGGD